MTQPKDPVSKIDNAMEMAIVSLIAPRGFTYSLAAMAFTAAGHHFLTHAQGWGDSLVVGFDIGVLVFLASLWPLRRDHGAAQMRIHAARNAANRFAVLIVTATAVLAVLAAISTELPAARGGHDLFALTKLLMTLALAWAFLNLVFMLHYAHMHYARAVDGKGDFGGFDFPGTSEPDYWDFCYFAFTAGMSFAASDVNVTQGSVRRIVVLHCLIAFLFNISALAFSINVLAGAAG